MSVHGSTSQRFPAGVVQKISAHNEYDAGAGDEDAGAAIAVRPPASTEMQRDHGAENYEPSHRGCTVESEQPRLRRILLCAELGFSGAPLVQRQPCGSADE